MVQLDTNNIIGYATDINPSYTRNTGKNDGIYQLPSLGERLKNFVSNFFHKAIFHIQAYKSEPGVKKMMLLSAKCIEAEAKLDAAERQELLSPKAGSLDRLKDIQKEFFDAINNFEKALNSEASTTPFNSLIMYYAHNVVSPQQFDRSKHMLADFPEGKHMHCDDIKFFFKDHGDYDDHRSFIAAVDQPVDNMIDSMRNLRLQLRSGYKKPIGIEAFVQFRESWNTFVNSHEVLQKMHSKAQHIENSYDWKVFRGLVEAND